VSRPDVPGYELLGLLGAGAHGQVYLARETEGLERRVALKVFRQDPQSFERELEILREVEAIRVREQAPGLVQSLSSGQAQDLAWIAFEYLDAGTLEDWVKKHGPMPAADAVDVVVKLADALDALHRNGVFHRDVKPSNVVISGEGRILLADFGLSRSLDGTLSAAGSPAFAAPELIAGRPTDGRAVDLYSLGATLAYLLTGETMLPGRPDVFVLERHGVPRPLQKTIVRAMATEVGSRFPDAPAFVSGLEGAQAPPPAESAQAPEPDLEEARQIAWALVEKAGFAAAAATALPIPGSEWAAVIPIHVAMVAGVGEVYGEKLGEQNARELLGQIGSTVGLSYIGSRVVMTAAKFLVPGLGGLVGAPMMFASTLALGAVSIRFFESGGELEPTEMRDLYKASLKRGRAQYDTQRRAPARPETAEERLERAAAAYAAGEIDDAEFKELKRLILLEL
jgi:serine/threonine protein kinase